MDREHRILIVDDNPRNVAILSKILSLQYHVAQAASGEEALETAADFLPDLILLDIMMPGLDGFETCRRLRIDPRFVQTKIIMVSAKTMLAERLRGYDVGANDYVTKPFDEDELLAKIRINLRLKTVEELDHLKSGFLTLLSHETRTPLTMLLPPCELLLQDPRLTSDQRDLVELIEKGGRRIHALLEKVSYLVHLRSGRHPWSFTDTDLGPLVRGAVDSLRTAAAARGVHFVFEGCLHGPSAPSARHRAELVAWIDGPTFSRAFQGVLDNAVRVSSQGGTVRIRGEETETHLLLSVEDDGPGVAPELLPNLFEEFASPQVVNHGHGTGLTLTTANYIVRSHGGSIRAESGRVRGALFTIRLPRQRGLAQAA